MNQKIKDEITFRCYKEKCGSCRDVKLCHDECVTCEEFDEALESSLSKHKELNKSELESRFLNKKVHVVINDPYHPIDTIGYVVLVDDACQLHGTWGGLAAILPYDSVELINENNDVNKEEK